MHGDHADKQRFLGRPLGSGKGPFRQYLEYRVAEMDLDAPRDEKSRGGMVEIQ